MRQTTLHRRLLAGDQITGTFSPADSELETPGVLSWSAERGADLELADRSDPWPSDFGDIFTVHGQPHDGEALTLLQAQVRRTTDLMRVSHVASGVVALGQHVLPDDRWSHARFWPGRLHEWMPETGLSIDSDEDLRGTTLRWRAPEHRTVTLPDGQVDFVPSASYAWSYSPSWSIETSMSFVAEPTEPLTIHEFRHRFRNPLLAFVIFATDRPDELAHEVYADRADRRSITILRPEHVSLATDWRATTGHFLFGSGDLTDVTASLESWFALWRKTSRSLALLCETIRLGRIYSVPRFLTLYTAAESYWKNTKTPRARWSLRALADRGGVAARLTGATPEALALMGAARNYHAHLDVGNRFSAEEISDQTFQSTRRLHALLQACLMREIGLDTPEIERLLAEHYRAWPVP
ncbi:hypothetical protein VSS74_12160 [Conexibacter stalactiti]|uniref:ApeA N-terminal domain-containing protein n=1 Tax=Conexibacter stalactiti TaxID=1940611 RepID=A0ABU4HP71_9ACTN|nr:hypothetical protein [Conexibacter stalactiti]MDW5595097.1 hypothetical protein [Conexibacter stalactiti]MEC5035739.1 hypothetical protein [Conexibacter stalactiti]